MLYLIMILIIMNRYSMIDSKQVLRHKSSLLIRNYNRLYSSSSITSTNDTININDIKQNDNEFYMRLALRHAQHSFREKEVPIGSVIADSNGIVIATGRNQVETLKDGCAHAELLCLRKAANVIGNWRLHNCTLYTTLEPCPMCLGAIQSFRIKKVVYGAPDHRLGACGSWVNLVSAQHPFHQIEIEGGVLQEESSILLKRFFQMRRREKADNSPVIDRGSFTETI